MIAPRLGVTLCLGLAFSAIARPAPAQWFRQSPLPTGLSVQGVGFFSAQHGFLATADNPWDRGGALFETTDGGATWVQRDVPPAGGGLNGLFFLDAQRGWLYGNDNFRTVDAGATWLAMPFIGSTYHMRFFTPLFGYASTNGGLYVTRDGGRTWGLSPNRMYAFAFRDIAIGLGASASGLYGTTDGGQTFALLRPGDAKDVVFLSGTVALAIVDDVVLRSENAGLTWTAAAPALGRNRLQTITADVVLAWRYGGSSRDGRLLRSADGGRTWSDLGTVFPDGTAQLVVAAAPVIYALELDADVHRSLDGGLTWRLVHDAPFLGLLTVTGSGLLAFPAAQTGYLAYHEGLVFKTNDGGSGWRQISNGYGASLADLDRFPDGRLIAVGMGGAVVTSDDGGTWTARSVGPPLERLEAVDVVDARSVVAMTVDGRVFRSTDRGETWTLGPAFPDPYFEFLAYDLYFTTPLEGWVVGTRYNFSSVYRTTDGGESWQSIPHPGLWVGVDFVGDRGWIVGNGGALLRTTDGGQSWSRSYLPGNVLDVLDIEFHDQQVGYAAGWYGYLARSGDGGQTWTILPTPHQDDRFSDLFLLGPDDVWASTYDDRAYHSTDGGQTWTVHEIAAARETFGSFSGMVAEPDGRAWIAGWLGHIYVQFPKVPHQRTVGG